MGLKKSNTDLCDRFFESSAPRPIDFSRPTRSRLNPRINKEIVEISLFSHNKHSEAFSRHLSSSPVSPVSSAAECDAFDRSPFPGPQLDLEC